MCIGSICLESKQFAAMKKLTARHPNRQFRRLKKSMPARLKISVLERDTRGVEDIAGALAQLLEFASFNISEEYDDDMLLQDSQYYGNRDDNPGIWTRIMIIALRLNHISSHPESEYNDGKGVQYIISLQTLPPPLKAGKKRRKNAKIDPINHMIYAHEEEPFADVLEAAIKGVSYENTLRFKVVACNLHTLNFTVTWTIPLSLKHLKSVH
ncbi:hypothetical protein K438DRAFT_1766506 [Mycena galopus ATCC 62051]|nr:hypothetical protein K438DRAFT_1766506 [Mycena galopus ATCC 62051]